MRFTTPRLLFILFTFALFCAPATAHAAQHKTIAGGWRGIAMDGRPIPMPLRSKGADFHISHIGGKWFIRLDDPAMEQANILTVTAADAHSIAYRDDEWVMNYNNGHETRGYDMHAGYNVVCQLTDRGEHLSCNAAVFGYDKNSRSYKAIYERVP